MKRIRAAFPAVVLIMALLTGCFGNSAPSPAPPDSSGAPSAPPAAETDVNLAVLRGPTGIGAAKLMADNDAGTSTLRYDVTIASANDEITAKLINGEVDIAALATNVASNLYHKTDGAVQIAAVNTLGVLHVLERGNTFRTIAGLRGKTIYSAGQGANPEYVLYYLLRENGLIPGEDVEIVWKTAEEISALMLSGDADVCMLPEPAATALLSKSSDGAIRAALDLSEEWTEVSGGSFLTMGCLVVRTAFAEQHPGLMESFLSEYAASIEYVNDSAGDAAELIAGYGLTPSAEIARLSIPRCNLVCITGADSRNALQSYYEVLYAANPDSIGGGIPDDAFYYIP